jgi:hypothetical protein
MKLAGNEWRAWLLAEIIQSKVQDRTLDFQSPSLSFLSLKGRPAWVISEISRR